MQVINKEQIILGKVTDLMQTGANDVLIVKGEKKYLIPFLLEKYVISIDKDKAIITVDWDADF